MTEKELKVVHRGLDLREAQAELMHATISAREGYKKLSADMEVQYSNLKLELAKKLIDVEREKACLAEAEENAERGFDTSIDD